MCQIYQQLNLAPLVAHFRAEPESGDDGARRQSGRLRHGLNMLIHSGDIMLFAKHLRSELETIVNATSVNGSHNSALADPHQANRQKPECRVDLAI